MHVSEKSRGIVLILVSAILASTGQLFWKLSNGELNPQIIVGFFLYGSGAVIMIIALKYGQLSLLQPFLGSSYVLSLVLARFVLDEPVGLRRVLGVAAIAAGLIVLSTVKDR